MKQSNSTAQGRPCTMELVNSF